MNYNWPNRKMPVQSYKGKHCSPKPNAVLCVFKVSSKDESVFIEVNIFLSALCFPVREPNTLIYTHLTVKFCIHSQ